MDPDVEIMFVTKIGQLIPEQKTSIHVSREFCRHTLPEDDEASIETIWNNRLKENPRLFNGTKFRLHSVTSDSSGVFTMNIGLTDYREYLGTNWAPGVERLRALGQREFADPQAFLSDPMGVGAFVVTCDDHVIFLKRSLHCAEAPAMWDIPGGHAEPEVRNGKSISWCCLLISGFTSTSLGWPLKRMCLFQTACSVIYLWYKIY